MAFAGPLCFNVFLSALAGVASNNLIKEMGGVFVTNKMTGFDMSKKNRVQIPEPMGVVTSAVYLIVLFLFIPAPFHHWVYSADPMFPYHRFVEFLAGLLSICCMVFLGFADDMFNLRWRHKLLLPMVASLPLLMVYAVNSNSTVIVVPFQLRFLFGNIINLGVLYYVYIGMVAVFCTNSINIYAGVNGLEAGQSLIISISILIFNLIQIFRIETELSYHLFSIYFLLPYVCTTVALLRWNWYPARVFVGDTFCYFSGMLFAVVGILGHFSKTLMLMFIPQIANFLLSLPQLFHVVPCPRHRLPRYNERTDKLSYSVSPFKPNQLSYAGRWTLYWLQQLGLTTVRAESDQSLEFSNLTLICLLLKCFGPMHEKNLTILLLAIQVCCSLLAFFLRFYAAAFFFHAVH